MFDRPRSRPTHRFVGSLLSRMFSTTTVHFDVDIVNDIKKVFDHGDFLINDVIFLIWTLLQNTKKKKKLLEKAAVDSIKVTRVQQSLMV